MSSRETIQWVSWPFRDEPARKTILLLALVGLTVVLAALAVFFAGLLAALLLFVLLGPYFLPTHYTVSGEGVVKRFPLFNRSRPWDAYRRYVVMKDGVFLGTFDKPSRLDSFRGDFIRFAGPMDREAVLDLVRTHVSRQSEGGEGAA